MEIKSRKVFLYIINFLLILYILALITKDASYKVISIGVLEAGIGLIIIFLVSLISWETALFLTIAYILTLVSVYKNGQNNEIKTILDQIIQIPSSLFGQHDVNKVGKKPPGRTEMMIPQFGIDIVSKKNSVQDVPQLGNAQMTKKQQLLANPETTSNVGLQGFVQSNPQYSELTHSYDAGFVQP